MSTKPSPSRPVRPPPQGPMTAFTMVSDRRQVNTEGSAVAAGSGSGTRDPTGLRPAEPPLLMLFLPGV